MLSKPAIHAEGAPKFSLLVVGRLHGLTRKRLRDVVEQVGGELLGRPSSRVDLVALAQGSAQMVLRAAPALELPNGLDSRIRSISEMTLKRMLRLVSPAVGEERTLDRDDVLRASKLSPEVLECLAAFDVVEPVDGQYAYRDVLVTREVRRLLDREYELATIVEASLVLRRSGASLSEVRLLEAPWGELVQETCGALASLTGQLTLPLSHDMVSPEDLFQRAEVSEVSGDLASAEHFYRAAMAVDRADAAIPYNLGNVLDAQGRRPEAILAYYVTPILRRRGSTLASSMRKRDAFRTRSSIIKLPYPSSRTLLMPCTTSLCCSRNRRFMTPRAHFGNASYGSVRMDRTRPVQGDV